MQNSEKFKEAVRQFDQANKADPNEEIWKGKVYPKELLYARRMSDSLRNYVPDASEALQLAVRCQHLCRWEIPRSDYPMDRPGYLKWRLALQKFHAEKAGAILKGIGYDDDTIERVQFLLQKKKLKRDAETQILEDVVCLVFLEFYFASFANKYPEEKLIEILRKTWKKMSEKGQQAALQLAIPESVMPIIHKALDEP